MPAAPAPEEPKARPKLKLAKRTGESPTGTSGNEAGGSSIFGGAKPVDTATKLAEVEEKIGSIKFSNKTRTEVTADVERRQATGGERAPAKAAASVDETPRVADEGPSNTFAALEVEDDDDEQ